MKKVLFCLLLFVSIFAKGQDIAPTDTAYHSLGTYSFRYYTKDSSVWIQKGPKYGTTKLDMARDPFYIKMLKGTDTVIVAIHKKDTLNLPVYKLKGDSLSISGYVTRRFMDSLKYVPFSYLHGNSLTVGNDSNKIVISPDNGIDLQAGNTNDLGGGNIHLYPSASNGDVGSLVLMSASNINPNYSNNGADIILEAGYTISEGMKGGSITLNSGFTNANNTTSGDINLSIGDTIGYSGTTHGNVNINGGDLHLNSARVISTFDSTILSPFQIVDTVRNENLNADYIDGKHASYFKASADTINSSGYFRNWQIGEYRKLNNHDSLSQLDERKYQSLTDTLTWGLGLSQTGHIVKLDTANSSVLSRQRASNTYQTKLTNPITGTGANNYIAKFTSGSAIGNSTVFDNGTNIGVGSITPQYKISVGAAGDKIGYYADATHNASIEFFNATSENINFQTTSATVTKGNFLFNSTGGAGNVGIGETTTPNSKLEIQGNAATDGPTLGAELLSSSGWTTTGWTGSFAGGFTNGTSNVTPLTNSITANTSYYYVLNFTITGRTAGNISLRFGGVDDQTTYTASGSSGFKPTTTDGLVITPSSTFNGTVIFSLKQVTGASTAIIALKSAGTELYHQRISNYANNVYLGLNSGTRSYSGTYNTAVGASSMLYNISGSYNTALGYSALQNSTNGKGNAAFGHQALFSNTTGNYNMGIGYQTLYSNTTGSNNTAIGYSNLSTNSSGTNNASIGSYAMSYNTTGYGNAVMGYQSLYNNTTGYYNTAISPQSLFYNTTGYSNIGIAYRSLYNNTTGAYNLGYGISSLYSNTTGNYNMGIGYQALYMLKPTSKAFTAVSDYSGTVAGTVLVTSTAHGLSSGTTTNIGIYGSVYTGIKTVTYVDADHFYYTGTFSTTDSGWWGKATEGQDNVAIGLNAGYGHTTASYNSDLGTSAGRSVTIGTYNTFAGWGAGYNASQKVDATNSTAIGYNTYTTKDNQVVLGNSSVTETLLRGNIGANTINPTATLHIKAGTATAGTGPLKFTSGTLLATPEAGLLEFDTDKYYATITTGTARKTFAFLESPIFTGTVEIPLLKFTKTGYGAYKALISDASGNIAYSRALGTAAYKDSTYFALTSHAHGNITSAGAIGSTSGVPIITTTSGVLTAGSFGTASGTFCQGNDSRLSDSRTASDVYAWAKASTKPSYTYSEVGAAPSSTVSYTDAAARSAISLTTTGTSGAATYNSATGVFNIPQYTSGSGSGDVTGPASSTSGEVPVYDGTTGKKITNSTISVSGNNLTGSGTLYFNNLYTFDTKIASSTLPATYSDITTLATTNRTVYLPDKSGTIAMTSDITGGSTTYPSGSGIPVVVSGASWGTTITNNSSNWNTAYGWGNWASNFGTTSGKIAEGNHTHSTYVPYTGATGDLNMGSYAITATSFCQSDSTLKRNIRRLESHDFSFAAKIDFRKFSFKADSTDHTHFGVIAQDVEKLVPEVVRINPESGKKEVNYTEMLLLIVAQQKEAIEKLEKRVTELENTTKKKNVWKSQHCIIAQP